MARVEISDDDLLREVGMLHMVIEKQKEMIAYLAKNQKQPKKKKKPEADKE